MKINELFTSTSVFEDINSKIAYINKAQGEKILKAFKNDGSILKRDATSQLIINHLAKADPTKTGEALQWLANIYIAGEFKLEDVSRINEELTKFFKFKSKLENKNLNSYKSIDDLYATLEKFTDEDSSLSKRQEEINLKNNEVEWIIKTPDFKALIPKTEAASKKYGSGTKWCTAADKDCMFNSYNESGDLIIIIAGSGASAKKFQLHYKSDSFMNDKDRPVSKAEIKYLSSFPQYKELLEILIKKHYFT